MSARKNFVYRPRPMSLESVAISRGIVESPATSNPLVEELRRVLMGRGSDGSGFTDFYRRFCAIDRGGSRTIFLDEFKIAFQRCNLNFSDQEISSIFIFFDIYDRRYIDFDEFFVALRGPIPERRRQLIDKTFSHVDIEGRGMIDPEMMIDQYDSANHPDVKNNSKKPQEIFRDFLRSFDVSTDVDGKVTRMEFENYYYNMSVCVDRDEYFEQVLCNTWHVPGGYDSQYDANPRSPQRYAYTMNNDNNYDSRNNANNTNNNRSRNYNDDNNNNGNRNSMNGPSGDRDNDRKYRMMNGPSSSYGYRERERERSMSPSARPSYNERNSEVVVNDRVDRDIKM